MCLLSDGNYWWKFSFFFCRAIRSLRNTVHQHLCVALFIAYSIFLFGIDKTQNKVGISIIILISSLLRSVRKSFKVHFFFQILGWMSNNCCLSSLFLFGFFLYHGIGGDCTLFDVGSCLQINGDIRIWKSKIYCTLLGWVRMWNYFEIF